MGHRLVVDPTSFGADWFRCRVCGCLFASRGRPLLVDCTPVEQQPKMGVRFDAA